MYTMYSVYFLNYLNYLVITNYCNIHICSNSRKVLSCQALMWSLCACVDWQVCIAACSSRTAWALRTFWRRWITARNPCRRSTSLPFCRRCADTYVFSVRDTNCSLASAPWADPATVLQPSSSAKMKMEPTEPRLCLHPGIYQKDFFTRWSFGFLFTYILFFKCWAGGREWGRFKRKTLCSHFPSRTGWSQVSKNPRIPTVSPAVPAEVWGLPWFAQNHTGMYKRTVVER